MICASKGAPFALLLGAFVGYFCFSIKNRDNIRVSRLHLSEARVIAYVDDNALFLGQKQHK